MISTPAQVNAPRLTGTLPALNGMRGLAVLLVFLFHAEVPGFAGSFIGVDIFFVLSGFLITVLLLQEYQAHGTISLKKFYLRRTLRLLPALLLLLLVYLVVFCSIAPDSVARLQHIQDALITLFYAANWTRAFDLGRPYTLGHCWSLSIEEQFYVLWPLLLLAIFRLSNRLRSIFVGLLFCASWGWRVYLLNQGASWNRIYNGFDTRADMLLAGCLLACLWHSGYLNAWGRSRLLAPVVVPCALFTLAALAVLSRWQTAALYQWQYALIALTTAVLILDLLSRPHALLARLFSAPVLVWLGTLSYGIYLWHYPVLHAITRAGGAGPAVVWLAAALTLFFALVSWYLVERPAQSLKKRSLLSG